VDTFANDPYVYFAGAKVEYNDAMVLFSEKKITSIQSIIPALELANQVCTTNVRARQCLFLSTM
jgi:hypothetical protein